MHEITTNIFSLLYWCTKIKPVFLLTKSVQLMQMLITSRGRKKNPKTSTKKIILFKAIRFHLRIWPSFRKQISQEEMPYTSSQQIFRVRQYGNTYIKHLFGPPCPRPVWTKVIPDQPILIKESQCAIKSTADIFKENVKRHREVTRMLLTPLRNAIYN
jgi:hypothetical protein